MKIMGKRRKGNRNNNSKSRNSREFDKDKTSNYSKGSDGKSNYNQNSTTYTRTNTAKDNDPAWYGISGNLVSDYGKVGIAIPVGADVKSGNDDWNHFPDSIDTRHTIEPGVMALEIWPTVGSCDSMATGINLAAQKMMTFIRQQNGSVTKIYDPADLMTYCVAVDSAHMFMYWLQRAYGIVKQYSAINLYYPQALIEANNINFQSISGDNIKAFKGFIDKFTNAISQFPIPANLSYFARHAWLYQNVYTDVNATHSQIYMYVPGMFYKYSENDAEFVHLRIVEVGKSRSNYSLLTLDDLINIGESLITALQSAQDLAYIAGDILKAYGHANCIQLYELDDNYVVPLTYSPEVLSQIQNAIPLGRPALKGIYQNPSTGQLMYAGIENGGYAESNSGYLQTKPSSTPGPSRKKITFQHDDVTPDDIMVATRLTPALHDSKPTIDDPNTYVNLWEVGTEIVSYVSVVTRVYNSDTSTIHLHTINDNYQLEIIESDIVNSSMSVLYEISLISQFDWAPEFFLFNISSGKIAYRGSLFETNCTFVLDSERLQNLHEVATLSEWDIKYLDKPDLNK